MPTTEKETAIKFATWLCKNGYFPNPLRPHQSQWSKKNTNTLAWYTIEDLYYHYENGGIGAPIHGRGK